MTSRVRDVMTSSVVSVLGTTGYKDIVGEIRRCHVSALPVVDLAGRVLGMVSEADLLLKEVGLEPFSGPAKSVLATGRRGERAKAAAVTAAELMSTPAITIGTQASVAEAAVVMCERGVKRLPVVDRAGRLVGIVSRADLLGIFDRPDEQIRDDVIRKITAGEFALGMNALDVTVSLGVVTVTGHVERWSIAVRLVEAIRGVEGVVEVCDRLSAVPHPRSRTARAY